MGPAWLRRVRAGLRDHEGARREAAVGETAGAAQDAPPPAPPPAAARPARLGPYQVVGELGRGGAGVVYVARSEALDRLVALKVIRPERLDRPELVERFEVEARAAARLRHPGIVAVHDVGEDAGRRYLVLELVPGRSLAARLRAEGPLPAREAARVALDLARALAYAHARRVLHRDLKPANVLLDAGGAALLSDFGLAKLDHDGAGPTVTGQVMGTPAYMPPEQARGEQERVDARSDVYGLGATLFEMLAGRPPFDGATVAQVLTRVTAPEPAPSLAGVVGERDRDLAVIVARALEKDPTDRYPTADALAADLDAWLADRPIAARPPSAPERARRWARRNPALARALAGVAVLTAAGLGLGGAWFLRALGEASRRAASEAQVAAAQAERADARAALAREALDALADEVGRALRDLPGARGRAARADLVARARVGLERLRDADLEAGALAAAAEVEARLALLALRADAPDAAADDARAVARARAAGEVAPGPAARQALARALLVADRAAEAGGDVDGTRRAAAEAWAEARALAAGSPPAEARRREAAALLAAALLAAARATLDDGLGPAPLLGADLDLEGQPAGAAPPARP